MKKVTVNASLTYDVLIEKGILDRAGELCRGVSSPCRAVIVTDTNVAPLYLDRVQASLGKSGFEAISFTIEAGEQSK